MSERSKGSGWRDTEGVMNRLLHALTFTDRRGDALSQDEGFERWREATVALRRGRGTMYLVGNEASASVASYFAADLAKNGQLHTQVFSDLSLITAISKDMEPRDRPFIEIPREKG